MRIAYVCADPGVPVYGRKGSSVHVQEVIGALHRRGARVTLLAARFGGDAPARLGPIEAVPLPTAAGPDRESAALGANALIAETLRQSGPFDAVYERHALWSYGAMEWAAERAVPSVLEVNAPLVEEQSSYRSLTRVGDAREAARRAIAAARSVAAVSDAVAAHVRAVEPGGHVLVVPNGVDTERFHPRRAPGRRAEGVTAGFVGTLKPWHGVETLIEAAALARRRAPGLRLLVVGDGPERDRLAALCAAHGLDGRAQFTGALPPEEVPAALTSIDIATAPYPPLPGFYFSPLKLYEYMAAGRAIAASRIGQIEAVIRDGETGLLCAPGDTGALAETLALLADDPAARARLGAAARAAAESAHTWDAVARTILRLFERPARPRDQPRPLAESPR